MTEDRAYKIGYKRPPQHSQFKRGQSGNPKGRPKGTLNLETDLREELSERIAIREGERSLKVSKQRALLKSLVSKALKGDARAASLLLQLIVKTLPAEELVAAAQVDDSLSEAEMDILEHFIAKRNAARKQGDDYKEKE
jgi:hypothetical protein